MPRPLPGIRFEPPPPPAGVLPRMDIAAFVGLRRARPARHARARRATGAVRRGLRGRCRLALRPERGEPARVTCGRGRARSSRRAAGAAGSSGCGGPRAAPSRFPLPGCSPCSQGGRRRAGAGARRLPARSAGTCADDRHVAGRGARASSSWTVHSSTSRRRTTGGGRLRRSRPWPDDDVVPGDGGQRRRIGVLACADAVTGASAPRLVDDGDAAPALPADLAGASAPGRADGPRRRGGARITMRSRPARRATASAGACASTPSPCGRRCPVAQLHVPEPPHLGLVDDVSAPPAGRRRGGRVVSGAGGHADRDPAGDRHAGVAAALALDCPGRALGLRGACGSVRTPSPPRPGAGALPGDAQRYADADGLVEPATVPVCGAGAGATWPRSSRSCDRAPAPCRRAGQRRRCGGAQRRRRHVEHACLGRPRQPRGARASPGRDRSSPGRDSLGRPAAAAARDPSRWSTSPRRAARCAGRGRRRSRRRGAPGGPRALRPPALAPTPRALGSALRRPPRRRSS